MIIVTTETIPCRKIKEVLGIVKGASVRALPITGDIVALMKNMVGGEVEEYTRMGAQAREQAFDRMVAHAETLGADAIIGMSFATCSMMPGAAEMLCYGTAVSLE